MQINITTNFPQVAAQLGKLRSDVASTVLARSLNRTIEQARTQMSREIRSEFNLKADYVRERLRIRKAFAASGRFSLSAELAGGNPKRRSANVIAFGARADKQGVSVQIKKRQRKTIKGAFIGNKGRTVFRRVEGEQMKSRPGRLTKHSQAIEPVRTIDVGQMFNTRRINAAVVAAMQARFPAIFQRELAFALSQVKG